MALEKRRTALQGVASLPLKRRKLFQGPSPEFANKCGTGNKRVVKVGLCVQSLILIVSDCFPRPFPITRECFTYTTAFLLEQLAERLIGAVKRSQELLTSKTVFQLHPMVQNSE